MASSLDLIPVQNGSQDTEDMDRDTTQDLSALEATYQSSAFHVGPEVEAFARAVDQYVTNSGSVAERRANIFKLVETFHDFSRQRLEVAKQRASQALTARRGQAASDMDLDDEEDSEEITGQKDLKSLEDEAQTWDLLRRLLPVRYRETAHPQARRLGETGSHSRNEVWDDFLEADSVARERKIVLEWLQTSASDGPAIDEVVKELQENAERGDIIAHGWLHTRAKIKLQKSVNGWSGPINPRAPELAQSHLNSNTLITQLDPDAMTRQDRRLEPQDEYFERAIWLGCYEMLRRGCSRAEIRDWCSERTEAWRAAAISGLPLSRTDGDDEENFSPSSVVLWRRMCYSLARRGGSDDYERAVFGLLSGDISSVEDVCSSWDDFMFAHYNALVRTQFDSYLIKRAGDKATSTAMAFPSFNAVQMHGDPATVAKRLIARLEADERTKTEACTRTKALQGAIIANDLDRHLYLQGIVICKYANEREPSKLIPDYGHPAPEASNKYFNLKDHDGLRILTHVFIVVSALDRLGGATRDVGGTGPLFVRHRVQEHVVAGYVSFLRLANLEEMIPLYCTMLQGARKYHTLSRNLIQILDNDARAAQVNLMFNLGIDITEFVLTQPKMYLEDVKDTSAECIAKVHFKFLQPPASLKYGRAVKADFFGEDPDLIDTPDEMIIRSLEWMNFVEGLFIETARYLIRAYKYFLKQMHLRAARALVERMPFADVVRQKTKISIRDDDTPQWMDDFDSAEFPEDFVEDNEASKTELVATVRNVWELECLVKALDSMETLASCAEVSRDSTTSRDMWTRTAEEIKMTKAYVRPLLHEWLMSSFQADPDFVELREAYLPETILMYISSLHFVGTTVSRDNLLECMDLAAVIAEKKSDVAQLFVKSGRMKELVEAFASCSKALAIVSGEKKGPPASSKKLRELGWSKELWSIKP